MKPLDVVKAMIIREENYFINNQTWIQHVGNLLLSKALSTGTNTLPMPRDKIQNNLSALPLTAQAAHL